MTTLLLDTHVLLQLVNKRGATLPPPIQQAIASEKNALLASIVSLWEIVIKHRLGKLELPVAPERLPAMWASAGVIVLDVTSVHVLARGNPDPYTLDPFDRLLLAICSVEKARLVTQDTKLIDHPLAYRAVDPSPPPRP